MTNRPQPGLFDFDDEAILPPGPAPGPFAADEAARIYAVDPRHNVVLEASAGTGKTTVLVQRYVNLLAVGVDPANILAITFTRKAAAEMRERIIATLKRAAAESDDGRKRWLALRDRVGDIAISTIDAFCYALLREFPLEAGLAPGFTVADETESARLAEDAIDRALARCRAIAKADPAMSLVLTRITPPRLRIALAHLVDRRLVARSGLNRYIGREPAATLEALTSRAVARFGGALQALPGGLAAFLAEGPVAHPRFSLIAADLRAIARGGIDDPPMLAAVVETLQFYFLTQSRPFKPRQRMPTGYKKDQAVSEAGWKRHTEALKVAAPAVHAALLAWARDLNVLLSRGVERIFAVTREEHRRTLAEHDVVDFPELLERAVELLQQMDEFSQSRYRLESRYHHVLVDEFQDTSRLQWRLVDLLVRSWGEGFGLVHEAPVLPSLFIVGDRKQSIYRFRDADVTLLDQAASAIRGLRPDGGGRRAISRSFRARPALLAFVNDICAEIAGAGATRPDAFRYDASDHFPLEAGATVVAGDEPPLGLIVAEDSEATADAVAGEIARLIATTTVRDRTTGLPRAAAPGDIAILFRSRDAHREFERALEARRIPAYVYKGLGFFDADEIKDLVALIRFLAAPASDLRAAAFARSRMVALSDHALARLAPYLAAAFTAPALPDAADGLDPGDAARLVQAREWLADWLALVDRVPPADLLDHALAVSGYGDVLAGARLEQARENVKKLRGLARRVSNRGYATMARLAGHIDRLATGDEANAVREAVHAVNLMTVHASKGLEFPIVFVVNIGRGVNRRRSPVRVHLSGDDDDQGAASVSIENFLSEQDTLEPELEREETKRLLYVALTRARDRLYLSAAAKEGAVKMGPHSLGQSLPLGLQQLIGTVLATADGELSWTGRVSRHVLRVARIAAADTPAATVSAGGPADAGDISSTLADPAPGASRPTLARLEPAVPRAAVTGLSSDPGVGDRRGDDIESANDEPAGGRLVGRLVHRLLARFPPGPPFDEAVVLATVEALVTDEERAQVPELGAAVARAVALHRRLVARQDVRDLFADGTAAFEVPVSLLQDGRVLRGTIDCLIRRPDGGLVVVEVKTGPPRPEHQRQLQAYLAAIQALGPAIRATGCLVHP
ncbi:MAG: UvrD-helicase domain-containing protein [Vicinamibacteraceae bacterium]